MRNFALVIPAEAKRRAGTGLVNPPFSRKTRSGYPGDSERRSSRLPDKRKGAFREGQTIAFQRPGSPLRFGRDDK